MAFSQEGLGRSPAVETIGRAEQRTAIERRTRFVHAARELATETGSSAFTVQQVVSRSGLSLKSFYGLFAGKDDLLVALLEEDIALGALALSEFVDAQREPRERLRAWVLGLFSLMAAGQHGHVAVLVREHRRLAESRPAAMAKALRPLLDLLVDELSAAARLQVICHRDPERDARFVFDLVLAEIHDLVLHSDRPPARQQIDEVANYVWGFCWGGLRGAENANALPNNPTDVSFPSPRERKQ
ncbi:MAG: TetR/AcrR family transcriptional regulator [Acidimicrobiales bacterium]|nr:TetR/AcrR family transcriptional regulator [Acidimicrobiales bacterium]